MPRFFFDTFDGDKRMQDDVGVVCDLDEVDKEAVDALPDIAREKLPDGLKRDLWVRVRDEEGVLVFEASLSLRAHWVK